VIKRFGRHFLFIAVLVLFSSNAEAADGRCFEPLADSTNRNPDNFKEFEGLTMPKPATGVKSLQTLDTGNGDANIDFYYVTFSEPQNIEIAKFFKTIRLEFPNFAKGTSGEYAFGPYENSEDNTDPIRAENLKKWTSNDPLGALMSFNLGGAWVAANRHAGIVSITEKAGDVQVICANAQDFLFATVRSEKGGRHPVAGFRGFGILADPKAKTWTFYSKAVDRDSGAFLNNFLRLTGDDIFCKGHKFWIQFFTEFSGFIKKRGMTVVDSNLNNHGPVPYPLTSGQKPAKICPIEPTPPEIKDH
jgi:hypothetical protein